MEQQFVTNLSVSIPQFKESSIDKDVIYYVINVSKGSENFVLEKRFSEFSDLYKNLSKIFAVLPHFPTKTIMKTKDVLFLQQRQQQLEIFIKSCLQTMEIYSSEPLKKFLQVELFSPETSVNPPRLIQTLGPLSQGVRDFIIIQNTIFVLNSEMNIAHRVDSYLTNMKMPWEKVSPPVIMSVASLECYVETAKKYEKLWSKNFKCQAICLTWNQNNEVMYVGLDSGEVIGIQVLKEYKFYKQEEVWSMEVHKSRIMGICVDDANLITISEDKHLKMTNLSKRTTIYDMNLTGNMLQSMEQIGKRLFIADSIGKLVTLEIGATTCQVLNTIQNQQKGRIRSIQYDHLRNYVFSGSQSGEICIFNVQKPGKDRFTQINASFNLKKKIRSIAWSSNRNEGMVGDEDGIVTFINEKNGQPIYALKAHASSITKVQYIEDKNLLITASKDKHIKFWEPPVDWMDKKVYQENLLQKEIIKKDSQKIIKKQDDSDSDDLSGWHK